MLQDIAEQEGARFQEIDKFEIEQSQEACLLKEQVAKLAEDKKALEERYKSLQEKSKASAKKQNGMLLSLLGFCCRVVE